MKVISQNEKLVSELMLVLKLFYSDKEIEQSNIKITHNYLIDDNELTSKIVIENKVVTNTTKISANTDLTKTIKYNAKILLYNELSKRTKKNLPWGSLTGIRPTKVFYEQKKIHGENYAINFLIKNYKVSKKRAKLLKNIIFYQKPYIANNPTNIDISRGCIAPVDNYATNYAIKNKNKKHKHPKATTNVAYESNNNPSQLTENCKDIDFYINIPFCTTKCYYCSFISQPLSSCEHLVQPYLDALLKEINATVEFIKHNKYNVKNVYVGGGTPTSITAKQLEDILKRLPRKREEFTLECGRADSINKEKLDILKKYNVTRISINPQTFNNETLKKIGRNHTAEDVINAFKLAREYPFIINMDLIAGLADENFSHFKNTIKKTLLLKPENITVHTLSVKRTSKLQSEGGKLSNAEEVERMVDYSIKKLTNSGYKPYYLYRQKNMLANLENIGYFKGDYACKFNINSMEEISSIIACGANAISKRVFKSTNRIERYANLKDINEYIARIDEIIIKKHELFD